MKINMNIDAPPLQQQLVGCGMPDGLITYLEEMRQSQKLNTRRRNKLAKQIAETAEIINYLRKNMSKLKTKASAIQAVRDRDEAAKVIKNIGDEQREVTRLQADMNDEIATITKKYQHGIDARNEKITGMVESVQLWAEANRATLCGVGKTVNLITGEISWRQRPPSVAVRAADKVIDTLKKLGLGRFVRVKEEVNKDAILTEPKAVAGVAGITINQGIEDFAIVPFEVEVEK